MCRGVRSNTALLLPGLLAKEAALLASLAGRTLSAPQQNAVPLVSHTHTCTSNHERSGNHSRQSESWVYAWGELTFRPRDSFDRLRRDGVLRPDVDFGVEGAPCTVDAIEFCWGAQILALVGAAACSLAFFELKHVETLRSHLASAAGGFGSVTAVIGAAVLVRLAFVWFVGGVSFSAYQKAGTTVEFRHHLRILYCLCSLDVLPAVAATLILLLRPRDMKTWHDFWSYLAGSPVWIALVAIAAIVQSYYLALAFPALNRVHLSLSPVRQRQLFTFAFAPVFVLASWMSALAGYGLLALAMVKNFD